MKTILLSAITFAMASMAEAQDVVKYIQHSSGNVLGANSYQRAVLVSSTSSDAKPLTLHPESDGTYTISTTTDGAPLYLSIGTENNWSTYFLSESTDNRAHYTIETSGNYVKLKNKHTSAYLGSDDNKAGAHVYSDKSGSDIKHKWRLTDTPDAPITTDTLSYAVCPEAQRQTIEGWGVSLCWWANMCGKWSDAKIDQIVRWMTSPTGLNWNVFRYNIGGGDDPNWTNCKEHHNANGKGIRAEMEGFQDERGGEFHWDRDAAQRKIMLKILEYRPDAIFEAFSNSAPWWMTISGCCGGNKDGGKDNLNPDYYEDFARYLVEVCKHYKEQYGIEFRTLEPFNEAQTSYWYQSGGQEGCHFDISSQIAFLRILDPILKESGLSTVISASDETNVGQAIGAFNEYKAQGVDKLVGQWNTHTYSADNRGRSQYGSLGRASGQRVWMSETGSGGSGLGGNLSMAQRLIDDVRYIAPEAWVDWQYMEEHNDQWCFVQGNFADATYAKVKNYSVRQQVTRFIRQGYTLIHSSNSQTLAAISPEADELVLVINNPDNQAVHKVYLPMARITGSIKAYRTSETQSLNYVNTCAQTSDSTFTVNLPEMSLTTLIIPVALQTMPTRTLRDGDTYMIVPQSNATAAASITAEGITLAPADVNDLSQRWKLSSNEDGTYSIKSASGYIPSYSSQYLLSASKAENTGQKYNIELIDGIHYRIVPDDGTGRAWDLEGQNINTGTRIGVWEYGTSAAADHRNWMLVRVASDDHTGTDIQDVPSCSTSSAAAPTGIHTVSGIRTNALQRGINIVLTKEGKRIKVVK